MIGSAGALQWLDRTDEHFDAAVIFDSTRQSNWIAGDCIYLVRVTPSPETINDASAYEFFAGR